METLLCDFCSATAPAWCYPASSFIAVTVGPLVSASEGGWAACEECHRLIEAGDRKQLAERSLTTLIEAHPEMAPVRDELIDSLRDLHARFFAHRCGAAISVGTTATAAAAAETRTRGTADAD